MSDHSDEKAFKLLEEAIYRAQVSLEKTKHFQPFVMLLNDAGKIEIFENEIKDSTQSYSALEERLHKRIEKRDVDVLVLLVDTQIPDNFAQDITSGIRVHLEERSQIETKIGARFLYVPYELCKVDDGELFVRLHTPIPVGFPAEYIVH